jgi:hypothetical protein
LPRASVADHPHRAGLGRAGHAKVPHDCAFTGRLEGSHRSRQFLFRRSAFSAHQAVEFVFRHGGNEPSLETGTACLLARRVLDAHGERDEAQRSSPRVLPQRVGKFIGVVRKCYIQESDSRRALPREKERARGSTNDANALVTFHRQQSCEMPTGPAVFDNDENASPPLG